MITIAPVVMKHHEHKDGTFPVKIRITYKAKCAYMQTPYKVYKTQLDSKYKIKDKFMLRELKEDLLKAETHIATNFRKLSLKPAKEISDYLYSFLYEEKCEFLPYVPFAREFIEKKRKMKGDNWRNYKLSLDRLISFVGREDLDINEINLRFLNRFNEYLMDIGVGNKGRHLYLANLRATLNEAKNVYNDEDHGTILIPGNPFSKFKMPRIGEAKKRSLSLEQLRKIIDYEPSNEYTEFGKDMFLLSFYLVGVNSADLFEMTEKKVDRIYYNRRKVESRRDDHGAMSVRIEPEAEYLFKKYEDPENKRIFNFYHRYKDSNGFNLKINDFLKSIGQAVGVDNLQFYAARHTWLTLFVNECGGAESDGAFCLGHVSDYRVTSTYLRKDFTRIDRANRKVLDLVFQI